MKAMQAALPKSRTGLIVLGIVGLLIGYAFASRAIDTGSIWQYFGAIAFMILGFRMILRSFKR